MPGCELSHLPNLYHQLPSYISSLAHQHNIYQHPLMALIFNTLQMNKTSSIAFWFAHTSKKSWCTVKPRFVQLPFRAKPHYMHQNIWNSQSCTKQVWPYGLSPGRCKTSLYASEYLYFPVLHNAGFDCIYSISSFRFPFILISIAFHGLQGQVHVQQVIQIFNQC